MALYFRLRKMALQLQQYPRHCFILTSFCHLGWDYNLSKDLFCKRKPTLPPHTSSPSPLPQTMVNPRSSYFVFQKTCITVSVWHINRTRNSDSLKKKIQFRFWKVDSIPTKNGRDLILKETLPLLRIMVYVCWVQEHVYLVLYNG